MLMIRTLLRIAFTLRITVFIPLKTPTSLGRTLQLMTIAMELVVLFLPHDVGVECFF